MAGRRFTTKLPSPSGVAAGQTALFKLPIGRTYHNILLTYAMTATALAFQDEMRLVANGKVIQRWVEMATLDTANQFDGLAGANNTTGGSIVIPVGDRLNMQTREAEEFTALGTGDGNDPNPITDLRLEIDINASAAAITMSALAEQSGPQPSGVIRQVRRFSYAPAAAGEFTIADLPRGNLWNRLFISHTNMTALRIERDGFIIFDRTAAQHAIMQAAFGYRTPQSGYFVVDFSEHGYGSEGLVTGAPVQDLRVICTMSAADTLVIHTDEMGPLTA